METNISLISSSHIKELRLIETMLEAFKNGHKTSAALVGQKGMGKTSLLKLICNKFGDEFSFINIKANSIANSYHFFKNIARELDYYPLETKEWKAYSDSLFAYMEMSNKKYVLVIDDCHHLASSKSEVLSYIRNKYQELDNLFIILTLDEEYKRKLFAYDKAFFGQLKIIELRELSYEETEKVVKALVANVNKETIDTIYYYSEGNPRFIEMLSLLALGNKSRDNLLHAFKKYFETAFNNELSPQVRSILTVMVQNENVNVAEITKLLYSDSGVISTQLKRLNAKGLIIKDEKTNRYRVRNYFKLLLG